MKRLPATLTFLSLFLFALPVSAFNWSVVVQHLLASTVQLQSPDGQGFCSGWVIDNERDYVITAEHCTGSDWASDGFMVDGIPGEVMLIDTYYDLAVVYVPGVDRPELLPQTRDLKVGIMVGSFGFAYGLKQPMFRAGSLSGVGIALPDLPGVWSITDQSFIGGMSGGPVVDMYGKVIMMVQRGNGDIGVGKSIKEIFGITGEYWKEDN